ncbi:TetR/AcrR family transcriptional regulator [Cedecea lapagei]|uniref:TetR/AcrR family transcriptional regulator n=1 Tax=Cedecea lapagei TaxID=158823 RepID=UPI001BCDE686|nr:TetR/AcrR family transcriptional regulator [Cedecea lapagei]
MPRVSQAQARLNKIKITQTATKLFRERGIHSVTLAEVMKASGLTHGGFYGHFSSKEALAEEACAEAFEQSKAIWRQTATAYSDKHDARNAIVNHYLAPCKLEKNNDTCPVIAFSGEMAREDVESAIHQTYLQGMNALIETYMSTIEHDSSAESKAEQRQKALVEYALMVGAMTLARAAGKTPLSEEILHTVRTFLGSDTSA